MQQVASDIERYGLLVVFLNVLRAEGGVPLPAFPISSACLRKIGKYGGLSVLAVLGLYLLARWWRRQAFIRQLRVDRITVDELRELISKGHEPLILDARPKEIRKRDGIIPGALSANPKDIDPLVMTLSRDREIVVYCACPNEVSPAIAAKHLKHAGFKNIRPLLGGIDAWVGAGQPLERAPSSVSRTETAFS